MEAYIISSLIKVFSDVKPVTSEPVLFSLLKNERLSFQIALHSEKEEKVRISVNSDDFDIKIYTVGNVPVNLACFDYADDYYLSKEPGLYPDILNGYKDSLILKNNCWQSVWVEISPKSNSAAGFKVISVSIETEESVIKKEISAEIIDASLPKIKFVYTNWYHGDGIANYYNVPVFSDEFRRINRNFIRTAAEHGMNCILTPIFTPPLDTAVGNERLTVQLVKVKKSGGKYLFDFRNLKKWIEMCKECGIEYFEMSHLFTQWGALHAPKIIVHDRKGRAKKMFGWQTKPASREYEKFILQLGKALSEFIDRENLRDKCFFHISDEPSQQHIKTYMRRAALMKKAFPGFTFIDALSDLSFYNYGAVTQPIPETGSAEKFYKNVPELWVYYCCCQSNNYLSNRFISMPSQRTRVLGSQLFKYNVKGFLQWGYNFYNSQYSLKSINPYEITDADGHFPSGDSFVVYPGKDGDAVPSLRLKVFYDALQDLRAMKLLESLTDYDYVMALIEEVTDAPLSFTEYPHSNTWQINLREKINKAIKENIKTKTEV